MKKFFVFIIVLFLFNFFAIYHVATSFAYDPTSTPNNHFGIHVIDTNDLDGAAQLVNSNGGDWGYVTLVIQKGERDTNRYQKVFDDMRRLHLIPIVRLATAPIAGNNNVWEKPSSDEIDGWVSFLNSLNWVIKNRYVIVENEPNHASEWGGQIGPDEYAEYFKTFSSKLKATNDNFFIMPAGLDASATNTPDTMDEKLYLEKMFEKDPKVFEFIDGWASHSYPNPAFAGPGDGVGKGTVSSFDWELNYLKFLGVKKDLPVFITETGWTHSLDSLTTNISPKIELAYKNIWSDKRVIAITPFIFKYISAPFDTFSWENKDDKFYDFYYTVKDLPKLAGLPIQEVSGDIITGIFPKIATANSSYHGVMFIKNTGQSIWQINKLGAIDQNGNRLTISSMFPESIDPEQIGIFLVNGKFPNTSGGYEISIALISNDKKITNNFNYPTDIISPPPNLSDILDYLKATIAKKIEYYFR